MKRAGVALFVLGALALKPCSAQTVEEASDPSCPTRSPCTRRTFFIQAEEVEWDFAPSGMNQIAGKALRDTEAFKWTTRYKNRIGSVYKKAQYIGYTDASFSTKAEQPKHFGILGPVIRAEVGDIIKIVFKNTCAYPYGVHSHGVKYMKEDEGAAYNNIHHAIKSSALSQGETHEYTWIANERAGPGPADGNSKLWAYHSHNADPDDIYSGLMGPIIIYRSGILDKTTHFPKDVDYEFVLYFIIFNENLSPYLRDNILKYAPELSDRLLPDAEMPFQIGGERWQESNMMHAINGRVFGNLDGLEMKLGSKVRWHTMGFGNEVDIHTVHWHSQTLLWNGHRVDVIELLPASFKTLETIPDTLGNWLIHCHVMDHQIAGMSILYHVLDKNDDSVTSLAQYQVSKTDMNVPAAPRPPLAEPLFSINAGFNNIRVKSGLLSFAALLALLL